jgi:hypothetical protein
MEDTGLRTKEYTEALAKSRRISVDKADNDEVVKEKVPLKREGKLVELAEKIVMMSLDTFSNGNREVLSGGKTTIL